MSPSSTPALTEHERPTWLYPFRQDAQLGWHGELVLRPLLPVSLVNGDRETPRLAGLVASGADLTLVSALLAEQLGIDLEDSEGEGAHRFGIGEVRARYKTIDLRLHSPDAEQDPDTEHSPDTEQDGYRQWRSQIGFVQDWPSNGFVVLGNVGFFDQFEVAISAFAHSVAVADPDTDRDASPDPDPERLGPGLPSAGEEDYVSAAPGPDFGPED
jgi:hypothetical protein